MLTGFKEWFRMTFWKHHFLSLQELEQQNVLLEVGLFFLLMRTELLLNCPAYMATCWRLITAFLQGRKLRLEFYYWNDFCLQRWWVLAPDGKREWQFGFTCCFLLQNTWMFGGAGGWGCDVGRVRVLLGAQSLISGFPVCGILICSRSWKVKVEWAEALFGRR